MLECQLVFQSAVSGSVYASIPAVNTSKRGVMKQVNLIKAPLAPANNIQYICISNDKGKFLSLDVSNINNYCLKLLNKYKCEGESCSWEICGILFNLTSAGDLKVVQNSQDSSPTLHIKGLNSVEVTGNIFTSLNISAQTIKFTNAPIIKELSLISGAKEVLISNSSGIIDMPNVNFQTPILKLDALDFKLKPQNDVERTILQITPDTDVKLSNEYTSAGSFEIQESGLNQDSIVQAMLQRFGARQAYDLSTIPLAKYEICFAAPITAIKGIFAYTPHAKLTSASSNTSVLSNLTAKNGELKVYATVFDASHSGVEATGGLVWAPRGLTIGKLIEHSSLHVVASFSAPAKSQPFLQADILHIEPLVYDFANKPHDNIFNGKDLLIMPVAISNAATWSIAGTTEIIGALHNHAGLKTTNLKVDSVGPSKTEACNLHVTQDAELNGEFVFTINISSLKFNYRNRAIMSCGNQRPSQRYYNISYTPTYYFCNSAPAGLIVGGKISGRCKITSISSDLAIYSKSPEVELAGTHEFQANLYQKFMQIDPKDLPPKDFGKHLAEYKHNLNMKKLPCSGFRKPDKYLYVKSALLEAQVLFPCTTTFHTQVVLPTSNTRLEGNFIAPGMIISLGDKAIIGNQASAGSINTNLLVAIPQATSPMEFAKLLNGNPALQNAYTGFMTENPSAYEYLTNRAVQAKALQLTAAPEPTTSLVPMQSQELTYGIASSPAAGLQLFSNVKAKQLVLMPLGPLLVHSTLTVENYLLASFMEEVVIASLKERHGNRDNFDDVLIQARLVASELANIFSPKNIVFVGVETESRYAPNVVALGKIIDVPVELLHQRIYHFHSRRSSTTIIDTYLEQHGSKHKVGPEEILHWKAGNGIAITTAEFEAKEANFTTEAGKLEFHAAPSVRVREVHSFSKKMHLGSSKTIDETSVAQATNSKGTILNVETFISSAPDGIELHNVTSTATRNILSSPNGKVSIFLGRETLNISRLRSTSSLWWQKHESEQIAQVTYSASTFVGQLEIDAREINFEQVRGKTLDFLANLENTQGSEVVFTTLEEHFSRRANKVQGPSKGLITLAALTTGILTSGISSSLAGSLLGTTTSGGLAHTVVSAGFSSLFVQSSVSLLQNNGNPIKAIESLGKEKSVIALAAAMVSAGIMHKICDILELPKPADQKAFEEYARYNIAKAGVTATMNMSIHGQSMEDAILGAIVEAGFSTVTASALAKKEITSTQHKLLQTALGAVQGAIGPDGMLIGALGGLISATLPQMLKSKKVEAKAAPQEASREEPVSEEEFEENNVAEPKDVQPGPVVKQKANLNQTQVVEAKPEAASVVEVGGKRKEPLLIRALNAIVPEAGANEDNSNRQHSPVKPENITEKNTFGVLISAIGGNADAKAEMRKRTPSWALAADDLNLKQEELNSSMKSNKQSMIRAIDEAERKLEYLDLAGTGMSTSKLLLKTGRLAIDLLVPESTTGVAATLVLAGPVSKTVKAIYGATQELLFMNKTIRDGTNPTSNTTGNSKVGSASSGVKSVNRGNLNIMQKEAPTRFVRPDPAIETNVPPLQYPTPLLPNWVGFPEHRDDGYGTMINPGHVGNKHDVSVLPGKSLGGDGVYIGTLITLQYDGERATTMLREQRHVRRYECSNGLVYEDAPYHGTKDSTVKSKAPTNPKEALENSKIYKEKSNHQRRLAYDSESGEIIVLDGSVLSKFHGHVRSWDELDNSQKAFMAKEFNFSPKGKIKNNKE